jgi:hypothetical protein
MIIRKLWQVSTAVTPTAELLAVMSMQILYQLALQERHAKQKAKYLSEWNTEFNRIKRR